MLNIPVPSVSSVSGYVSVDVLFTFRPCLYVGSFAALYFMSGTAVHGPAYHLVFDKGKCMSCHVFD